MRFFLNACPVMKAMYSKCHSGLLSPPEDDFPLLLISLLSPTGLHLISLSISKAIAKRRASNSNAAAARWPRTKTHTSKCTASSSATTDQCSLKKKRELIFSLGIPCSVFFSLSLKGMIRPRLGGRPEILLAANPSLICNPLLANSPTCCMRL